MFLYKITNLINGKIYIGVTKGSVAQRFRRHIYHANLKKSRLILHCAIRKYGDTNFTIEHLSTAESWDELLGMERGEIARSRANCAGVGYNMTTGGGHGGTVTDEVRKRMSASARGRQFTPEHRAAISRARKGISYGKRSDETRAAISQALKGRSRGKCSDEARAKITAGVNRRLASPAGAETRAKISAGLNRHYTLPAGDEHRANISCKLTGVKRGKYMTRSRRFANAP